MGKMMIPLMLVLLLLAGCGTKSEVRKEMHDDAMELYTTIYDKTEKAEIISDADMQKLNIFQQKYQDDKSMTPKESDLLESILFMAQANTQNQVDREKGDNQSEQNTSLKDFIAQSKKVKDLLDTNQ